VRLDEGSGDREPEPRTSSPTDPAEHGEDPLAICGGDPRSSVLHAQLNVGTPRRGNHAYRGALGGVTHGIIEKVRDDLLHEHLVDVDGGQVDRHLDVDGVRAHRARLKRTIDDIAHRNDRPSQLERARADPRHVEQVGHEAVQCVSAFFDEREELVAIMLVERAGSGVAQRAHSGFHRGERRAKVVRDGADELGPQLVDPFQELGAHRLAAQLAAIEGKRRMVRVGLEKMLAMGVQRRAPDSDEPDRAAPGGEGNANHVCPGHARHSAQPLFTASGQAERCELLVPRRPGRRRDNQVSILERGIGDQDGRPMCAECLVDGVGNCPKHACDGLVPDQDVGEVVEPLGGIGVPPGVELRTLQRRDDPRHDQHHGGVDAKGGPILRRADVEGAVGWDEEDVVGDEPRRDRKDAAREAADGDACDDGDHEDERRRREGQVAAQGHHRRTEHADAGASHQGSRDPSLHDARHLPSTKSVRAGRRLPAPGLVGHNGAVASSPNVDDESAQAVRPAGRFRVYIGSAAGVGKTCAMLDEGWRRLQRGTDVVIGFVETHGRPHTAELMRDIPVVPRKEVTYRGTTFTEMDLDAVLARHPEVALVDELAHTNVPGSGRHQKRWEDVLELLEMGVAVITTVNIQHLESLADAVESITGARVRERVPDWVVRKADQLELIDSSADQLRRRMLHGNIYPPDKVRGALNGFFRTENLVALRELALRFVADETEEELLRFLEQHRPSSIWDTTERILATVTAAPGSDAVVRRAARMARRAKGELYVLHVRDSEREPAGSAKIDAMRVLAHDVGGSWLEVASDDPARTIVEVAAEHQVTQIVVGASQRSRWNELTSGSVVRKVLRAAAERGIDVHVIARRELRSTGDLVAAVGAGEGEEST
jgi:two-component system sensor histidine kinase KdpD